MLPKEVIEHFIKDSEKEWYIFEYTVSSILPKKSALEEYKHANMKCCDNVRLYKINSVDDVKLIKEKS